MTVPLLKKIFERSLYQDLEDRKKVMSQIEANILMNKIYFPFSTMNNREILSFRKKDGQEKYLTKVIIANRVEEKELDEKFQAFLQNFFKFTSFGRKKG